MCGITAFFARESSIDYNHLDTLFMGCERRGQDGFGFTLIKKDIQGNRKIDYTYRNSKPYSLCKDEVRDQISLHGGIGIGELIIAITRAAPETEGSTDENRIEQTMQPIVSLENGLVVVHNGAVSNKIHQELKINSRNYGYEFKTDIDSEAILAAYCIKERNMKDAMEYLSGGFASIIFDGKKDMLYTIVDFKPLAHSYLKGLGFFLHSDVECIRDVIYKYTGCNRDGEFLWESWYGHLLSPGIREIDLQSGFMRKIKYSPRYITQTWDSNYKKSE